MKLSMHLILQILAGIVAYGTVFTGVVPTKIQPYVVLGVSAAQGALAWYNHYFTPQGQKLTN